MNVDPLTLAVVRGALEQIAEEMDWTLKRTAFSPAISEGNDLANGIYHPNTGEIIAQGKWGLAIFIGVMQFTTEAVISDGRLRGIEEGDIYIVNDPYAGGTHLMDVGLVKPVFYQGELFAFLANRGHWPDIGGSVPGGFGTTATEMFQEGLRVPPVKLYRRGELNEDVLRIMLANVRVPDERYGDLQAHLAAFSVGEERLRKLLNKYGRQTVNRCIEILKARSKQQMNSYLRGIADGSYEDTDYMDSDGVEDSPLKIALTMTIRGGRALLDFSQSSPPCRGPLNCVLSVTKSACYLAFKHIFPDIPVNSGCFEPLSFDVPQSTFLNATPPRPVAGCASEVSQRVADVVMGALGKAVPERASAGIFGTINNLSIGGSHPEGGPYVMFMFNGGGYGGHQSGDGLNYGSATISVARSQPVELYEKRYPVRIGKFALRDGSGGAGKHRGGLGAEVDLEFLGGEGVVSILADRGKFAPRGVSGGSDGANCSVEFELDGQRYVPPHITKASNIRLKPGDSIRQFTPGGGGYGDPFERDEAMVLDDVRNEYISRESARKDYGVAIRPNGHEIDWKETARLRQVRGVQRVREPVQGHGCAPSERAGTHDLTR